MTDIRYTAAWVPDDAEHRPWEVAFALAADWIEAQPGQPLLITPRHERDAFPAMTRFANTHSATTLRSGRSFRHSGPVLAYMPDYEMMDLATEVASDATLAVVETIEYPMMRLGNGGPRYRPGDRRGHTRHPHGIPAPRT